MRTQGLERFANAIVPRGEMTVKQINKALDRARRAIEGAENYTYRVMAYPPGKRLVMEVIAAMWQELRRREEMAGLVIKLVITEKKEAKAQNSTWANGVIDEMLEQGATHD